MAPTVKCKQCGEDVRKPYTKCRVKKAMHCEGKVGKCIYLDLRVSVETYDWYCACYNTDIPIKVNSDGRKTKWPECYRDKVLYVDEYCEGL
jgi:hypothetical protein